MHLLGDSVSPHRYRAAELGRRGLGSGAHEQDQRPVGERPAHPGGDLSSEHRAAENSAGREAADLDQRSRPVDQDPAERHRIIFYSD